MAEINWDALQAPDFMGSALKAEALGQAQATSTARRNALARYSTDPDGAVADLMAVDPEAALQLRKNRREEESYAARQAAGKKLAGGDAAGAQSDAVAAGDFDMATAIAHMGEEQRKAARQNAEDHGAYALSLNAIPYAQRKAKIMADAPRLLQSGFTMEQLQAYDPTDANNNAQAASAMDLKTALEQHDKDRNFGLNQDRFGEEKRHNQVGEGTSRGQLGVSQAQLGVSQAGLGIRQAELGLSRDRLAFDQAGGKLKPLPPQIAQGHAANQANMKQIDAAISAIDKHPQALGLTRIAGENINQRADPAGVDARAALANIGSLKLHERSGAAVSASESPRLMPFIPLVTDTPDTAKKKLRRLRQELQNNNAEMEVQYGSDSGYQPLTSTAPNDPGKRPPLSSFHK